MPSGIKLSLYGFDVDIGEFVRLIRDLAGAKLDAQSKDALKTMIAEVGKSFDVVLDNGAEKKRFHLNRSYSGLYVCPMIWRELDNFSSGSACLVLASNLYDEDDYFRDYNAFLQARKL